MNASRRGFLGALLGAAAAPLIAKPTLEDIERLTYRRRYWPGIGPGNLSFSMEAFTGEVLRALEKNLVFAARVTTRKFDVLYGLGDQLHGVSILQRPGDDARHTAEAAGVILANRLNERRPRTFGELQPMTAADASCVITHEGVSLRGMRIFDPREGETVLRFDVLTR